jgi:hypothetical protein
MTTILHLGRLIIQIPRLLLHDTLTLRLGHLIPRTLHPGPSAEDCLHSLCSQLKV